MAVSKKALNYDLDDKLLQLHYPKKKSYKNAWTRVKKFLINKGFEDRQYSGVVSKKPMSNLIVQDIILELNENYYWLGPCVKRFDVTNVGNTYNLTVLFSNADTAYNEF